MIIGSASILRLLFNDGNNIELFIKKFGLKVAQNLTEKIIQLLNAQSSSGIVENELLKLVAELAQNQNMQELMEQQHIYRILLSFLSAEIPKEEEKGKNEEEKNYKSELQINSAAALSAFCANLKSVKALLEEWEGLSEYLKKFLVSCDQKLVDLALWTLHSLTKYEEFLGLIKTSSDSWQADILNGKSVAQVTFVGMADEILKLLN